MMESELRRRGPETLVKEIGEGELEAWDKYVKSQPYSHYAQTSGWKTLVEATYDCESIFLASRRNAKIVGILPLFRKRGRGRILFSAPGGLIADDLDAASALVQYATHLRQRWNLRYVELRDQRVEWPGLITNSEHCAMVLELPRSLDDMWKHLDSGVRRNIKKGRSSGLLVEWGSHNVPAFYAALSEHMRDLGTPIRDAEYFRRALTACNGSAEILTLRHGELPVGGMFLVSHGDAVYDPWVSSLRRYFPMRPNEIVYWQAIGHAISLGKLRFDFGRSQWGSGTFRFKEKWGAVPQPLYYQYILAPGEVMPSFSEQKRKLHFATEIWKRVPLKLARLLGEPIRRATTEVL